MLSLLDPLFSQNYMPEGYCYLWQPSVLWIHVIADTAIAVAFFSIPLLLLLMMRKRRGSRGVMAAIAVFCLLSGMTHLFSVIGVWAPLFLLSGVIKVAAACASLATAVLLFPLLPRLLTAMRRLGDDDDFHRLSSEGDTHAERI